MLSCFEHARARTFGWLAVAVVITACDTGFFTEPAATYPGSLDLQYSTNASALFDPRAAFDSANNVRIRVSGPGVNIDTVLPFTPAEETRVRLALDSTTAHVLYRAEVMIRRDSDVLLAGFTQTAIEPNAPAVAAVPLSIAPVAANALTVGFFHACALDEVGAAFCWGSNSSGQLGTGGTNSSSEPVLVSGDLRFIQIVASFTRTCGLTASGEVYCWGLIPGAGSVNTPALVPTSARFVSITAGHSYTCGLTADQTAFCWGVNRNGQLGTGDSTFKASPVPAAGGLKWQSISAGLQHACGLATDGRGYCWGNNRLATSGTGSSELELLTPTPIMGTNSFSSLAAGAGASCSLAGTATFCWGTDFYGSLGLGPATNGNVRTIEPRQVVGGNVFRIVRPSEENYLFAPTCALTAAGNAFCWGANDSGQLGTAASMGTCSQGQRTFSCSGTPLPVAGGLTFTTVEPGADSTCGFTTDRRLFCWGGNESGQLGTGTTTASPIPVLISAGIAWPRS